MLSGLRFAARPGLFLAIRANPGPTLAALQSPCAAGLIAAGGLRRFCSEAAPAGAQLRVCVVGAGPAGFYSAKYLLRDPQIGPRVRLDMLDASPVPYGLIRSGVAPDHPEVKNVANDFASVASDPRYRFFGNVEVGKDVSLEELRRDYSAVVFAHGCERPRRLGLPGERLEGVRSAAELVAWYNGDHRPRHPMFDEASGDSVSSDPKPEVAAGADTGDDPRHAQQRFRLAGVRTVAVIGQGNVALDCARILCSDMARLRQTDIPEPVLRELAGSDIRRVMIIGRRGPLQMACTIAELRELAKLGNGVRVRIHPEDLGPERTPPELLQAARELRPHKRKLQLIEDIAAASVDEPAPEERVVEFRFLEAPVSFEPRPDDPGRLGSMVVQRMEVDTSDLGKDPSEVRVRPTGVLQSLPCDLVLSSIGYQSPPLPGLPHDSRRGTVPNEEGRVVDPAAAEGSAVLTGVYVSGWAKRGSTGIVGSNIADARQTVASVVEDALAGRLREFTGHDQGLDEPQWLLHHTPEADRQGPVTQEDWLRIEQHELQAGSRLGKPREKLLSVRQMLEIVRGSQDRP